MRWPALISLLLVMLCSTAVHGESWQEERYPTFFAHGPSDTKVQISLKRELMEKSALYFAYTLQGLWLRDVPSTPFKELTHRPEIYWNSSIGEVGYEHLSNGLDNRSTDYKGEKKRSRSLQRLYWKSMNLWDDPRWSVGIKLMAPIFIKKSSPYHDYLGYQDLVLAHRTPQSDFSLSGGLGPKGGRIVCALSVNPLALFDSVWATRNHTWMFFEYYHGHAETLIDYRRSSTAFRIGLRLLL